MLKVLEGMRLRRCNGRQQWQVDAATHDPSEAAVIQTQIRHIDCKLKQWSQPLRAKASQSSMGQFSRQGASSNITEVDQTLDDVSSTSFDLYILR
jgi:hypothetical protein